VDKLYHQETIRVVPVDKLQHPDSEASTQLMLELWEPDSEASTQLMLELWEPDSVARLAVLD
jgi:hypothetical protein